jgi:hypothetical protein
MALRSSGEFSRRPRAFGIGASGEETVRRPAGAGERSSRGSRARRERNPKGGSRDGILRSGGARS